MSFRHPEKLCLHQSLLYSPSKGGSITSLTPVRAALEVNNQPLFSSPSSFHLLWSSVFCSSISNSLTLPMQFPSSYLTLPTNLMQHSSCKGGSEESWHVEWKPGRSGRGRCVDLLTTEGHCCRTLPASWFSLAGTHSGRHSCQVKELRMPSRFSPLYSLCLYWPVG